MPAEQLTLVEVVAVGAVQVVLKEPSDRLQTELPLWMTVIVLGVPMATGAVV